MWPRDAFVGQKVVCINTAGLDCSPFQLEENRVYEIGDIRKAKNIDKIVIGLNGIASASGVLFGFYIERFRPVQKSTRSTETGMRLIKQIADGIRQPDKEEA